MNTTNPDGASSMLLLPHLNREVLCLSGADHRPMLPLFALCQLLDLDPANELHAARRILLWGRASLLPLPMTVEGYATSDPVATPAAALPQAAAFPWAAWCLPYPLEVGYWFGNVYDRVLDPSLRQRLWAFIQDNNHLSGAIFQEVQARFEAGRARMRRLPLLITTVCDLIARLQAVARLHGMLSQRDQVEQLALRAQALRDQAETFLRAWFAHTGTLPVVDTIRLDDTGQMLGDLTPVTLFGVFSAEDDGQLALYEQAFARLLIDLDQVT